MLQSYKPLVPAATCAHSRTDPQARNSSMQCPNANPHLYLCLRVCA